VSADRTIPDPKVLPPAEFNRVRDVIGRKMKDLLTRFDVDGG
jgi:hypothetical protein